MSIFKMWGSIIFCLLLYFHIIGFENPYAKIPNKEEGKLQNQLQETIMKKRELKSYRVKIVDHNLSELIDTSSSRFHIHTFVIAKFFKGIRISIRMMSTIVRIAGDTLAGLISALLRASGGLFNLVATGFMKISKTFEHPYSNESSIPSLLYNYGMKMSEELKSVSKVFRGIGDTFIWSGVIVETMTSGLGEAIQDSFHFLEILTHYTHSGLIYIITKDNISSTSHLNHTSTSVNKTVVEREKVELFQNVSELMKTQDELFHDFLEEDSKECSEEDSKECSEDEDDIIESDNSNESQFIWEYLEYLEQFWNYFVEKISIIVYFIYQYIINNSLDLIKMYIIIPLQNSEEIPSIGPYLLLSMTIYTLLQFFTFSTFQKRVWTSFVGIFTIWLYLIVIECIQRHRLVQRTSAKTLHNYLEEQVKAKNYLDKISFTNDSSFYSATKSQTHIPKEQNNEIPYEQTVWMNVATVALWEILDSELDAGGVGLYLSQMYEEIVNIELAKVPPGVANMRIKRFDFGTNPPILKGVRITTVRNHTCVEGLIKKFKTSEKENKQSQNNPKDGSSSYSQDYYNKQQNDNYNTENKKFNFTNQQQDNDNKTKINNEINDFEKYFYNINIDGNVENNENIVNSERIVQKNEKIKNDKDMPYLINPDQELEKNHDIFYSTEVIKRENDEICRTDMNDSFNCLNNEIIKLNMSENKYPEKDEVKKELKDKDENFEQNFTFYESKKEEINPKNWFFDLNVIKNFSFEHASVFKKIFNSFQLVNDNLREQFFDSKSHSGSSYSGHETMNTTTKRDIFHYLDQFSIECDELVFDVDFIFISKDMDIELSMRSKDLKSVLPDASVVLSEVILSGELQLKMKLTLDYPFIGNATASFLKNPSIDLAVSSFGGVDLSSIPLCFYFLNTTMHWMLSQYTSPKYMDLDMRHTICPSCDLPPPQGIKELLLEGIQYLNDFGNKTTIKLRQKVGRLKKSLGNWVNRVKENPRNLLVWGFKNNTVEIDNFNTDDYFEDEIIENDENTKKQEIRKLYTFSEILGNLNGFLKNLFIDSFRKTEKVRNYINRNLGLIDEHWNWPDASYGIT